MKLRTTVQLSGAITSSIQKTKPPLKREDSFLKRFSTRQIAEAQVSITAVSEWALIQDDVTNDVTGDVTSDVVLNVAGDRCSYKITI